MGESVRIRENLGMENADLRQEVAGKDNEIANCRQQVEGKYHEIANLRQEVAGKDNEIANLGQQLATAATIQSYSINGKELLQSLNVVYGNTYRHVAIPDNDHVWCGFIRFENRDGEPLKCFDFIDRIVFNMRGHFGDSTVSKPSKLGTYQTAEHFGWG